MKPLALSLTLSLFAPMAVAEPFSADVWADNWFAFYVDGTLVGEDSVPITTERSFNEESFTFEAERPFVIGLIAKDFKENDSGLEYIGSRRQQMGDGGVILQVRDGAGEVVAVSNSDWMCLATHVAPLDKSCADERAPDAGEGACGFESMAEPEGWNLQGFDAAGWAAAEVYSVAQVRPKDGYDRIDWDEDAALIWGEDLETVNTLLCRFLVE